MCKCLSLPETAQENGISKFGWMWDQGELAGPRRQGLGRIGGLGGSAGWREGVFHPVVWGLRGKK